MPISTLSQAHSTHHKAEQAKPCRITVDCSHQDKHTDTHIARDMGLLAMAMAKAKAKASASTSTSSSSHNNGMGLLLVFFPQDNSTTIADKTKLNFPSTSKSPSSNSTSTLKRTNSSNIILSKTQSTISICALLLFITLLLFTLSTFEPTIPNDTNPRRFLLHKPPTLHKTHNWAPKLWPNKSQNASKSSHFPSKALQRMGTLYRRGTRGMADLVVCHVADETTQHDFRLFLRLIHRSGLTAKTDVVFLFASPSSSSTFANIIHQENDAFSSLVELHTELNSTLWSQDPKSSFNLTRFFFNKGVEIGEPLWGKRTQSNLSNLEEAGEGELNGGGELLSYGSVLSFDATELDPENSLAGFLDRVPLSLRRWACYPMLLGRVRRNFKHVMLVDVENVLILNDPLGRVRNRSPESVFLFTKQEKKHKRNSDKTRLTQRLVDSAVVMGGARGVRRLCNAVLVEIVRAAMQHKKKNSVSDSAILSQLVENEFMLKSKNVDLIASTESIPEASSLGGRNSGVAATSSLLNYAIIQRGTSNNHGVGSVIKKEICSAVVDSSVYRDC